MARSPVTGRFMKQEQLDLAERANEVANKQLETEKQLGSFVSGLLKLKKDRLNTEEDTLAALKGQRDLTKEQVDAFDDLADKSQSTADAIEDLAPGMVSFAKGAEQTAMSMQALLGPIGIAIGIFIAIFKVVTGVAKKIAETRKDLGVSAAEAVKLEAAFFGIEKLAALSGLEAEDLKESFKAARDNLGATTDEALGLSLNLAKAAMQSGTTADQLTSVLSVMESVSGASREALLAQIEINRQLIGAAGLAPADIFRDIADNAEFFAQFAKDGSQNIVQAGIAAKKLGLNMSAVASITESLLDFESSIESQLEASLLLGRQINLDRARQLALAGDQSAMMEEILRQVGGEAEFNKMNVIQRKALAQSVGVNVEQLSRLVRNNTAGGTAGAVGAAVAGASNTYSDPESHRYLAKIARNTE
mgnify:CR=1 FL=1|tara:strand:+ start:1857 stop:3113 length:1257 start_codon:yes stop_codon:yes gene_type:complete